MKLQPHQPCRHPRVGHHRQTRSGEHRLPDQAGERLRGVLLEAYLVGLVHLSGCPMPACARPGARPRVSGLARAQYAAGSEVLTTLLGDNWRFEGEFQRQLLPLLDGRHDRAEVGCLARHGNIDAQLAQRCTEAFCPQRLWGWRCRLPHFRTERGRMGHPMFLVDRKESTTGVSALHRLDRTLLGRGMRDIGRFLSDARIPRVATIRVRTAQSLAEPFEVVRQSQAIDVFHVLVTELPRDPKAQGASKRHGKFVSVHAVGEKRLRVERAGHVDAGIILVGAAERDITAICVRAHVA